MGHLRPLRPHLLHVTKAPQRELACSMLATLAAQVRSHCFQPRFINRVPVCREEECLFTQFASSAELVGVPSAAPPHCSATRR